MWILGGDASEDDGETVIGRVSALVEGGGGEVTSTEFWGRRTLAYPIGRQEEGLYYLARFKIESGALARVDNAMSADQSVLRHLITRLEAPEGAGIGPRDMDAAPP
jgi:small subunit ribosomal protein S6